MVPMVKFKEDLKEIPYGKVVELQGEPPNGLRNMLC